MSQVIKSSIMAMILFPFFTLAKFKDPDCHSWPMNMT